MNKETVLQRLEAGTLDWKRHSWEVAKYYPEKLDPERYNWRGSSLGVLQYCPELFTLRSLSKTTNLIIFHNRSNGFELDTIPKLILEV